jgi:hypothetical protein
MARRIQFARLLLVILLVGFAVALPGQQRPQWLPGQVGLNAGILPSPGFTYVNIAVRYSADRFNGPAGNNIVTGNLIGSGNFTIWADESLFYYVSDAKILGGNIGFALGIIPASGYLTADILPNLTDLTATAGGSGVSDLFVEPFALGWHLKRADIQVAEAVMPPTGRYTPGATDNIGSGYFGNMVQAATTVYLTKNKGTSANLYTNWEVHGARQGANNTDKTPGQAFTDEWGLGQVLPLKKNFSQLLQVGAVGYDQWQITANSGTIPVPGTNLILAANQVPFYSVHAVGGQANYILSAKELAAFFKYYHEYEAYSHYQGNTLVFGVKWSFLIPKPAPPKP